MFYYDPVAKVYSGTAPVIQSAKKVKKPTAKARVSAPKTPVTPEYKFVGGGAYGYYDPKTGKTMVPGIPLAKPAASKAAAPFVRNGVRIEYDKAKKAFSFYDAKTGRKLSTKGFEIIKHDKGIIIKKKGSNQFVSLSELLNNKKATKTAKKAATKGAAKAAKKGAPKTASTVADLIPFGGKNTKFKIKQLKNGQYRITGLKGNTLPINRELIIKKTKKGFSIIDKASGKRVSVKSILAKLKGKAKNGVKDVAKNAAPAGFFGKIAAAAKANPVAATILGLIGVGMAAYAVSNSGSKRINYEV